MKKILYSALLFIISGMYSVSSVALVDSAAKKLLPSGDKKLFITTLEEKKERLETLKQERKQLQETQKQFIVDSREDNARTKQQINQTQNALDRSPDNEFFKKKLELQVDYFHARNDEQHVREQLMSLIEENIKVLSDYLADPELKTFKQKALEEKPTYSFDKELLDTYELIVKEEKELAQLIEQEANASGELENRKRALIARVEENKKKETAQAKGEPFGREFGFTNAQKAELLDIQEKVINEHKKIDQIRLTEIEYQVSLVKTKIAIVRQRLDILHDLFKMVKPLTTITESDVTIAQEELDKKKQHSFQVKTELRGKIEGITALLHEKENELERIAKRYNITIGAELDQWENEPRKTVAGFSVLVQVGALNDVVLVYKRGKDHLEALLALEEAKLQHEGLRIAVKESFFKVSDRKFSNQDEVAQEIKKYDVYKAQDQANLALNKGKQNTIASQIAAQKKALESIKQKERLLVAERDTLFKGYSTEYVVTYELLSQAKSNINKQLDLLSKTANLYTEITGILNNSLKHIEFIASELSVITIWYRPEHAISWQGIQNSGLDVQAFVKDVYNNVSISTFSPLADYIKQHFSSASSSLISLLMILLVLTIIILMRRFATIIVNWLVSIQRVPTLIRMLFCYTAAVFEFIAKHIISITVSIMLYWSVVLQPVSPDPYLQILFYLCSILYLLYLSNRWIASIVSFNTRYDYILISKEYQRRFVFVLSVLLYATIIIFFFREAFILGNYRKSEVPSILLALYFIIVQISAILLIVKEQLLSLIPKHTAFWNWVYETVDTFYYLFLVFLVAIIVMSNPYVGFGRLVLYILNRLFYSFIVIQLLSWLHSWLKRVTSRVFFYDDEELLKERFVSAKTWYGFIVVGIFLLFTFVAMLFIARIWSWPEQLVKIEQWHDVMALIKTPILLGETSSPISLFTLFKIFGFVLTGVFVAVIINTFILRRIFDILLTEPGVQNTIASLTRYLVVITAIILGFQSVGLGELVWYLIGALILGIGWVIKDPVSDFIAYFIILVQRPVKVGDYIWIDNETVGLVRKVTPRSVIVRRKNSTTILIPNTQVMNKVVVNWNYIQGFIAFDDILITIAYEDNPELVRELLFKVLNESSYVLKNPRPIVRLEHFGEYGFEFLIRGFLSSNHTLDQWDIASDIRFALIKKLKEKNISLAYPVRLVRTTQPDTKVLGKDH